MSRKIQTEGAYYVISDDNPIDESELQTLTSAIDRQTKIMQPNFIIDMRFNYEYVQLQALWLITKLLQPVILQNIHDQTSLFIETEGAVLNKERNEVEVIIPLQTFGYQRHRYEDLRKALTSMACIRVLYPKESYKIRETIHGEGVLCTYVGFSRNESNLRQQLVHFFFSLDVATCLVSPKIGFTQLLQETLYSSANIYTAKIYMWICRSSDSGRWPVSYEKLREILCVGDKFPRYYDFRNRILKVAERELYCNSNHWFSLVEQFPRRGAAAPDILIFNIFSIGKDQTGSRELTVRKRKIFETMTGTLGIKEKTAQSVLHQINSRNIDYIWRKHNTVLAHMADNSDKIDDRNAYYIATIKRIIETEKYSQSATQQSLFEP